MKRSSAVMLIAAGTLTVGAYAVHEQRNCRIDGNGVTPPGCQSSSSGFSSSRGSSGSTSFYSSSGSSQSSSTPASTAARGGFGATGAAHSAGS